MPVDPASLVALSGLTARDLPDDAELIAETSPVLDGSDAVVPAPGDVDGAVPFWMEPVSAEGSAPALPVEALHAQEALSDVGIGLVAASPVVEPAPGAGSSTGSATGPRPRPRPVLPSWADISVASRAFAARHLPEAPLASLRHASFDVTSLKPASWTMPDLGTFPTLDAQARRRLALLAGSSMAAGLAAGLAVPVAAEAAPAGTAGTAPTGSPSPAATETALLAAPSPFAHLTRAHVPTATPAAPKPAAAKPAASKPAAAKPAAAKPVAAKPAAPTAPAPTAPAPTAPAPTAPVPAASPTEPTPAPTTGDPAAALLAALIAPATSPFSAAPSASAVPARTAPSASPDVTGPPTAALPTSAAPAAPAVPASTVPASALPGRTTAAAVVVVADPPAPHPGRPAPPVAPKPVTPVWKVTRPLPAHSGTGRRIVYAERSAHLWIVGADGTVLRDYKVTGRADRPKPGTYQVFSKSKKTSNPKEKLTFDLMVRFTRGVTGAPIGFHTIPKTYSGRPIQSEKDLGRAIGMGGCVRQSRADAEWLYAWSRVGDTVVVLH